MCENDFRQYRADFTTTFGKSACNNIVARNHNASSVGGVEPAHILKPSVDGTKVPPLKTNITRFKCNGKVEGI